MQIVSFVQLVKNKMSSALNNQIHIFRATKELSAEIAVLAGDLLQEIMERIGSRRICFQSRREQRAFG